MDWFLYDNGLRHERVKDDHFSFNPFTEKEVINFISKLPTNKPSFPKDTLVFIPKRSIHVYRSKLTIIMNSCLKKQYSNNSVL